MKHPLTSKERRGVVAIAAATLLCLAAGPLLRRCVPAGTSTSPPATEQTSAAADTIEPTAASDTAANKASKNKTNKKDMEKKKRKKAGKQQKGWKVIPTRSPLDEACD